MPPTNLGLFMETTNCLRWAWRAATTLSSVYTANGSTLNAVVNPNGWDTTVYFQWGTPA